MTDRSYQVIARKWRPQRFAEVVGQEAVVRTLTNALAQDRIAHAYCFSGIRGVGKTTVARLLAKGLNCRNAEGPTAEPCGECESCREVMDGRSMDVIERDAASDRGIHEMKELIEIARYSPSRDRYKVFILDEAHMLTPEASNALLKVLEEPPSWIVFVLATTEPNKILPTILSRCQHYQFGRISQREITGHLAKIADAEGVRVSDDGLALLATAADGSLRDGQSLLDKLIAFAGDHVDEQTVVDLLGLVDRVLLFRATELVSAGDVAGTIAFVDEMVDSGVDLHQFTIDLLGHLRNLLVARTVRDAGGILHLPEGDVQRLRQQAEGFTVDDLDRAFSLVAGSEYRIKNAEQPRYHLELVLARLARMPRLEPIEDLLAALRGDGGGSGGPTGDRGRGRGGAAGADRSAAGRSGSAAGPRGTSARAPRNATPAEAPDESEGREEPEEPGERDGDRPGPPRRPDDDKPELPEEPEPPSGPEPPSEPEVPEAPEPPAEPEPEPPTAPDLPGTPPPDRPRLVPDESPTEPTGSTGASEPAAPAAARPATFDKPVVPATTPARDSAQDLPLPALLRKIQERVNVTNPLIAQILGRSSGISLAGEKVTFQFPESAGIFVDRLRDPEMLRKLAEAARTVTGRQVTARIETHAGRPGSEPVSAAASPGPAGASDEPTGSEASAPPGPRLVSGPEPSGAPAAAGPPAAERQGRATVSSGTDRPPGSGNGAVPAATDSESDTALRRRAEQEPQVQEFVKALRGQIVSVEKL